MEKYKRLTDSKNYSLLTKNELFSRLHKLETKIDNKTLCEMPCKVGATVWRWVIRDCYDEWTVDKICFYIENGRIDYTLVCSNKTCGIEYFYKDDKNIEWCFEKPQKENNNET